MSSSKEIQRMWIWITIISMILLLYIIYKCFTWFCIPYFEGSDKSKVLKEYKYFDPKSNTEINFPTIESKATKCISIIIPAYNEEKRINLSLDPTIEYLNERTKNSSNKFSWEIIVVNDGSKDNTTLKVLEYTKKYGSDKVRLLSYPINQGKGYAVQQGMLHARGCCILFADADGASEIRHLERLELDLYKKLNIKNVNLNDNNLYFNSIIDNNLDGIGIGSRKDNQKKAEAERNFIRNIAMWGMHLCVKYIGNVKNIKDSQCGFKLFTRSSVIKLFLYQKIRRWAFDVELLMLAQLQNIIITETSIKWEEVPGSKLSVLKASFSMLREMIWIRYCYITGTWYTNLSK